MPYSESEGPLYLEVEQELVRRIQSELVDVNEDSSSGDPRYEIHAEKMAGLLEEVLKANGAEVPEVPEW